MKTKKQKKTKECSICKEVKQIEEFSKHGQTADGRQTICKSCANARYTNSKKKGLTFCGLENDITGFGIGKPRQVSKINLGYFIEK